MVESNIAESDIEALIRPVFETAQIDIQINGNSVMLQVISDKFIDLKSIKRQQLVYSCINEKIKSGEMHAVSMKLFTPEEWEKQKNF